MTKTEKWLMMLSLATILMAGSVFAGSIAFADDDDDDDDDKKKPKTLESECAKQLKKKNLNLNGLFCPEELSGHRRGSSFQNQNSRAPV